MQRNNFERDNLAMASITVADLRQAEAEEGRKEPISNKRVCCRGGLGVAAASGEAHSTQGLLEVWQSSQELGKLGEIGRGHVVQSLQD